MARSNFRYLQETTKLEEVVNQLFLKENAMKRLVACATMLYASSAWATAVTDDFIGPLSNQTYTTYVDVSGDALTCQFNSSGNQYLPIDWAFVELKLVNQWDRAQVLEHGTANAYVTADNGDPNRMCAIVQSIKQQADESGYLLVEKTSTVEVRLQPSYGQGCIRVISEIVSVKLSNDLVLTTENYKFLSGEDEFDSCR